jgi:hypothetical protein
MTKDSLTTKRTKDTKVSEGSYLKLRDLRDLRGESVYALCAPIFLSAVRGCVEIFAVILIFTPILVSPVEREETRGAFAHLSYPMCPLVDSLW